MLFFFSPRGGIPVRLVGTAHRSTFKVVEVVLKTVWDYPRCTVIEVHDGDTVKVDIDHGMAIWSRKILVRLFGIAALELSEPGGPESRDYVSRLLPEGEIVRIRSYEWDKYGRLLGEIYLREGETVQARMLADKYAVPWDGKGKQPKPNWPIDYS